MQHGEEDEDVEICDDDDDQYGPAQFCESDVVKSRLVFPLNE